MKCFVTFRLKPGVTPEEYDEWFRTENVPAIRKMASLKGYRVWRVSAVTEGEPSFDVLEEMEFADRTDFERELEEIPEISAMLDGWYGRVTDQVILFAEEVAQE